MSEQELRDMFSYASEWADQQFRRTGRVVGMWHAVPSSGDMFVMLKPHPDKDIGVAMIRALFDLRDVVRYIFVDEAWMLIKQPALSAEELESAKRGMIWDHPDRIEVVMFSGEDAACGQIMARRRIFRPEKGKPYLGPFEWMTNLLPNKPGSIWHSEGRMVGLLPVRGMRQ